MIFVEVPARNDRVWEQRSKVELTDEAEAWLEKHVGHQQFRHPDAPEYTPPRPHWIIMSSWHPIEMGNHVGTRIFFSDASHAMLFKLTWL